MKSLLFAAVTLCCLFAALSGCDYEYVSDCDLLVDFRIEQDTSCADACEITFVNLSRSNVGISYRWNFGDGGTSSEESPSYQYKNSGTFVVTLTVLPTEGCPSDELKDTIVIKSGGPVAKFTLSSNFGVAPHTVTFTSQSENFKTLEWLFDGEVANNQTSFSRNFDQPDTIVVTLKAIAADGRTNLSAPQTLIIRPLTFFRELNIDQLTGIDPEITYGLDEAASGGYFLAVNNLTSSFLAKTDLQGNLLNAPVPAQNMGSASYGGIRVNRAIKAGNDYLLVGKVRVLGVPAHDNAYVLKANNNFGLSTFKDYFRPTVGNETLNGGTLMDNGHYLFCGTTNSTSEKGVFLVETNTDLSLVPGTSQRVLFTDKPLSSAQVILNWSDGYVLAGSLLNPTSGAYEACVFRLSETFNLTSTVFLGAGITVNDMIALDDQTVAMACDDNGSAKIAVINLTTNDKKIQSYPSRKLRRLVYTADKRLVAAGWFNDGVSAQRAAWFRIDPKNASLSMETVSYPLPAGATFTDAYCLFPTRDGGFILGGEINDVTSWLIKTDNNGKVD